MALNHIVNRSTIIFGFAGWALALGLGIIIIRANYDASVLQEQPCSGIYRDFFLSHALTKIDSSHLVENFPYGTYLDSSAWCNPVSLIQDLNIMDSLYPGQPGIHRQIISSALTDTLEYRMASVLATYHPDTLTWLLQWASRFGHYQDIDKKNAKVYRVVYRFWFNKVSNLLGKYADADANLKYEFKFKYLSSVCHTQRFTPPVGRSKLEKVIDNVINQKFSYLFNRFWHGTKWHFKIVALTGIMVLIYALWCIYRINFKVK